MVVGSVLALSQTDVKRLLAYSSIAHAGFLLTGFLGARSLADINAGDIGPGAGGALLRDHLRPDHDGCLRDRQPWSATAGGEATHLSRWAGLGKESPLVAGVFAFLLLGMAGIPLTSGFTGKWAVFAAALSAGAWPVVIVAVLMSAVAAYFYVRVIVVMFFADPVGDASERGGAERADQCGDRGRRGGHARAGRRAGSVAGSPRPYCTIHQMSSLWPCPILDA